MSQLEALQISNLESFKEIRASWEHLYKTDSNSQVYISWLWLYSLFTTSSFKWTVVAIKKNDANSSYVAFLPMTLNHHRIYPICEITHIGKPIAAYSGFLCLPDFESEAIPFLAKYIQSNLKWDIFRFDWIRDSRLDIFLSAFSDPDFKVDIGQGLTSLRITLPDNYQTYLNNHIGKETRRKIRRRTKYINEHKSYKVKYSTEDTVNRDIDVICQLWFNRWKKDRDFAWYKKVLQDFAERDLVQLCIIWDQNIAISALACLIDPLKKTYYAFLTAYNPDYSKISPGIVVSAYLIEQAIEKKYKYYDLTVGLDPYKLSFGPMQHETKNVLIKRKSLKMAVTSIVKKQVKVFLKRFR